METILPLLATTGFIVWFTFGLFITIGILLENEFNGWANSLFSILIALWIWNYGTEMWGGISSHPLQTIGFIVMYLVMGGVWSFVKWFVYVKSIFTKFSDIKKSFRKKYGIDDSNVELHNNWGKFTRMLGSTFKYADNSGYISFIGVGNMYQIQQKIKPLSSEKKSVIISWITYWPVSMISTLLNNPFRKLFEFIYNNLSGFYDRITNKFRNDAFGEIKNEEI